MTGVNELATQALTGLLEIINKGLDVAPQYVVDLIHRYGILINLLLNKRYKGIRRLLSTIYIIFITCISTIYTMYYMNVKSIYSSRDGNDRCIKWWLSLVLYYNIYIKGNEINSFGLY